MNPKIKLFLSAVLIVSGTTLLYQSTQSYQKVLSRGERYFNSGRYHLALPYLTTAFRLRPGDLLSGEYLLQAYDRLGEERKTQETLEILTRGHPDRADLLEYLADLHYHFKEYGQAEQIYGRALNLQPQRATERKLAEVLVWQKKYSAATPLLERLTADRADTGSSELLADVYSWEKNYDGAIALYKKLLEQGVNKRKVTIKLAEALRFAGKNEEALQYYNQYFGNK